MSPPPTLPRLVCMSQPPRSMVATRRPTLALISRATSRSRSAKPPPGYGATGLYGVVAILRAELSAFSGGRWRTSAAGWSKPV